MDMLGLALCSRFSYPPNSLSLCGPDKKNDLLWYTTSQTPDLGTIDILTRFSTLYPYLSLIAHENNIRDPFDRRVVEAYWIGNTLLNNVSQHNFSSHLTDTLDLKRRVKKNELTHLMNKIPLGAIPFHAFHVLNIYKRTGHLESLHTIQSMDACIINWGKVITIQNDLITVLTQPLTVNGNCLIWGPKKERILTSQGKKDSLLKKIKPGDWISYHWGYFCQKLSKLQLHNLVYYTDQSIKLANSKISY